MVLKHTGSDYDNVWTVGKSCGEKVQSCTINRSTGKGLYELRNTKREGKKG